MNLILNSQYTIQTLFHEKLMVFEDPLFIFHASLLCLPGHLLLCKTSSPHSPLLLSDSWQGSGQFQPSVCVCEKDIKRIHLFIHSNSIYKHPLCSMYYSRHWDTKPKISFVCLKMKDRMGREMGLQTINIPFPLSRWVQSAGGQSEQVKWRMLHR